MTSVPGWLNSSSWKDGELKVGLARLKMVRVVRPGGKVGIADFVPAVFGLMAWIQRMGGRVHPEGRAQNTDIHSAGLRERRGNSGCIAPSNRRPSSQAKDDNTDSP